MADVKTLPLSYLRCAWAGASWLFNVLQRFNRSWVDEPRRGCTICLPLCAVHVCNMQPSSTFSLFPLCSTLHHAFLFSFFPSLVFLHSTATATARRGSGSGWGRSGSWWGRSSSGGDGGGSNSNSRNGRCADACNRCSNSWCSSSSWWWSCCGCSGGRGGGGGGGGDSKRHTYTTARGSAEGGAVFSATTTRRGEPGCSSRPRKRYKGTRAGNRSASAHHPTHASMQPIHHQWMPSIAVRQPVVSSARAHGDCLLPAQYKYLIEILFFIYLTITKEHQHTACLVHLLNHILPLFFSSSSSSYFRFVCSFCSTSHLRCFLDASNPSPPPSLPPNLLCVHNHTILYRHTRGKRGCARKRLGMQHSSCRKPSC